MPSPTAARTFQVARNPGDTPLRLGGAFCNPTDMPDDMERGDVVETTSRDGRLWLAAVRRIK